MLMVLSIMLLIILQGFWLRAEYKAASDSFRRETHLIFRSTLQHLADSMFFSQMEFIEGGDTLQYPSGPLSVTAIAPGPDKPNLPRPRMRRDESRSPGFDSLAPRRGNIDFRVRRPYSDSVRIEIFRQGRDFQGNMRFLHLALAEGYPTDTLKILYRKSLPERYQELPFEIIEKEVDWQRYFRNRQPSGSIEDEPFTTGFVPLGLNKIYAARFSKVKSFLLYSILPQIGFSIIITGLIILSFFLVLKSLRSQQRLLEQKNDFIGNMTHELKTPVATVGVALEAMKSFDVLKNPEKALEYIDMARHELDRLGMMTDKILKTSVFDYESEIRNNRRVLDLKIITEKVMTSFQLVAQRKGTKFLFDQKGDAHILGHEDHLTQMIYNLVDNAFKYADESPEIKLSLEEQPDYVVLRISDQGPGISPEHQSRIFEKFYRIPSGNVHTVKGYGLGLNYVSGVVKSHEGKISLESKPGAGTVFEVKLPKDI